VDRALALAPEHISLYGLTIEPRTPLGRWQADGRVVEAPEERYEREYLHAHRALGAAGFEHYEVSNFARPGLRARHNAAYWRRVAYVGVGPAAHSFDGGARRWNAAAYADWARRVEAGRDPEEGREVLTQEDEEAERVYLTLRTDTGLALDPAALWRVRPWVEAGWGTLDGERLRLSAAGWLRLDELAADLTLSASRS
jgi:oxygen-independent coproporphyrinogen-3 oxidase